MASASDDNTIRLWDIGTGKEMNVFREHKDAVNSVAFTPDGKTLASASDDNTVRLWDIATNQELVVFNGHTEKVFSAIFSPNGTRLASASRDNTVRLWDVRPYTLFLYGSKPSPLYDSFMDGVHFLWHVKLKDLEFVPNYTPTLYAQDGYNFSYDSRFRSLLAPPPPGQSKFNQVLGWAQQQKKKNE